MKLRAHIKRDTRGLSKSVTLTFPVGVVNAFVPERIIARNIGPRPWSEIAFHKDGKAVRVYVK